MYDPGSPDTGRTRSGDTLDDRYASVRRTVGPAAAPRGPSTERQEGPEADLEAAETGAPAAVEAGADGGADAGEAGPGPQPGDADGRPGSEREGDEESIRDESIRDDEAVRAGESIRTGEPAQQEPEPDALQPSPNRQTPWKRQPSQNRQQPSRESAPPPGARSGGAPGSGPAAEPGPAEDAPVRQPKSTPAPPPDPRTAPAPPPPRPQVHRPPGANQPTQANQAPPEVNQPPRAEPQPGGCTPDDAVPSGSTTARNEARRTPAAGDDSDSVAADRTAAAAAPAQTPADPAGVEAAPRDGTGGQERAPGRRVHDRRLRPGHVGERPPTYEAEPATLPAADSSALSELVPDTVLDGAHYGGVTLRAASLRGDSARHRGALRRDALLAVRFGDGESALLLVAVAAGGRAATGGHRAAREICHSIGGVVGRSHVRLAEDIRADRRAALKSGLQRLTDRCYGRLRAQAAALELRPEEYTADLRCLLLTADPRCRTRVFFGAGAGGLFRLRSGAWGEVEPGTRGPGGEPPPQDAAPGGSGNADLEALDPSELGDLAALSVPLRAKKPGTVQGPGGGAATSGPPDPRVPAGSPSPPAPPASAAPPACAVPPSATRPSAGPAGTDPEVASPQGPPTLPELARPEPEPFRFCATASRRGDVLLLCSPGLAEPMRAVPGFAQRLAHAWSGRQEPPGLADFLADVQLRVRGYAEDRTAVAVWEG